jgi:small neutral amino acid transporter SnatA (MarC family)
MSFLFKIIVILGLIFLIVGQFTRSKQQRVARRDKWTNVLLIIVIAMLGLSILSNFLTR